MGNLKFLLNRYFLFSPSNKTLKIIREKIFITVGLIFIGCLFLKFSDVVIPGFNKTLNMMSLFDQGQDGGYLDSFQCLILFWIFLTTLKISKIKEFNHSIFIPFVYLYLCFDDFFGFHGSLIGNRVKFIINKTIFSLNNFSFFRQQDLAEFIYWLFVATIVTVFTINSLGKGNKMSNVMVSGNFFYILCLGFFGIILDISNASIFSKLFNESINLFLNLIEEFGEVLIISFAYIWNLKNYLYINNNNNQTQIL